MENKMEELAEDEENGGGMGWYEKCCSFYFFVDRDTGKLQIL